MIRKRILGILLALTFLMNVFVIQLPKNAEATTTTFSIGAEDGSIRFTKWYPGGSELWQAGHDAGASVLDTGYIHDWYLNGSRRFALFRGYYPFDTSSIPANVVIQSAKIRVFLQGILQEGIGLPTSTVVNIYTSTFMDNDGLLKTDDWNKTGDYQSTIWNVYSSILTFYEASVSVNSINRTGWSQFATKSSYESAWNTDLLLNQTWYSMTSEDIPPPPNPDYSAKLIISYEKPGAEISIELDSGAFLNTTVYAEISDWNVTYDLYYFALDTVPNSKNITLYKGSSNWTLVGLAPGCNYTENSSLVRLEDVYDNICYRIWITAPKSNPYSTVHVSLFNSFTGEGFYWEQWKVQICPGSTWDNTTASTLSKPDFFVESGEIYILRALDFFNNPIVDLSFSANAQDVFVSLSIPVYSYKFYSQNPSFALLRVYYNLTGTPYSEFIPPYDYVARYLKAGTYKFMITFYDKDGIVGNSYQWIRTIPDSTFPGAGFVMLEGDTISEAIIAANGAKALVQVVADLVSPDMLWIGYMVPQIPGYLLTISDFVINQNLYMVNGNTLYTANGTNMSFPDPYPVAKLSPTTTQDDFTFTGSYYTSLYVNETNGTVAYNSTVLPSMVALAGHEYGVWSNESISVARDINWRWYRAFTYQYFPNTKLYMTTIEIENMATEPWRNVTVFIPFQNASYVDNRSVAVWDINNTAYLIEGQHFLLTKDGIYLWWAQWNVSVDRAFTITYQAINETWNQLPVQITVNQLGDGTTILMPFQNRDYYFVIASWTNTYRESYDGPLYIKLSLTVSIDPDSVIVLTDSGAIVTDAIVAGTTVIIPRIVVGVGEKISYTILFDNKQSTSVLDFTLGSIPVILITAIVTVFAFIVGAMFILTKREKQVRYGRVFLGISVLGLILIVVIYMYYLATG